MVKSKKWADITGTVAHIAVMTNKRASIRVNSTDFRGRPQSGDLIFDLDPEKMTLYEPYFDLLRLLHAC